MRSELHKAQADQPPSSPVRQATLADRYLLEEGRVLMTGVQALVRLALDRHRADRRRGLRTATLISGYQGSPLAGLDIELRRNGDLLQRHDIVHIPALNEELGATAAWGSQLAQSLPGKRYDGVTAMWYGKAPGLDRAADALRHGNWVGTGRTGGALALVGDDPAARSSTLPSASEAALADLGMPTLYPANVQEVLDLGLLGIDLSRACGLWVALKLVTDVADAVATVQAGTDLLRDLGPGDAGPSHEPHGGLLAPATLELERSLVGERLPAAADWARRAGLNPVTVPTPDAWLGIVCAGKPWADLAQALEDLDLGERDLERLGVRVMKVGLLFPLDGEEMRAFAAGLEEVLVIEEKRPFLELHLKETLYGLARAPLVVGKEDEHGRSLLAPAGELDAPAVARALVSRLAHRVDTAELEGRLQRLERLAATGQAPELARTPFFCSGCPHNRSTTAPEGTPVGIGIGCHTMVLLNPRGRGTPAAVTQMGGEGAQWIGMEPFTSTPHFVQNLGDGTFHHSGSLGIRFAVAAGSNVTFKLLVNGAVAMTGGQDVEGELPVPELTRLLEAEGVVRTIVTTDETGRYRSAQLAANAEVRDRSEIDEASRELASTPGVTVLVHDQACAAELRRARRRGRAPDPDVRVTINERVCEGCGDCSRASGACLSLQPVETEFGRKTRVDQSSCNKDLSCLDGDCPSFLTVVGARQRGARRAPLADIEVPDPLSRVPPDDARIRITGIGGTGVVTANQIIAMAALLDGKHACGLDQTGLSQKAGPVVSDLRITATPVGGSARPSPGGAHAYLVLDMLGAAAPSSLTVADPERTVAIVSTSEVPTGQMVADPTTPFPPAAGLLDGIEARCREGESLRLDAQALARGLFDDEAPANAIMLGAAWQHGAIPVSLEAMEEAIGLNGVAVERNVEAFRWGRIAGFDPRIAEEAAGLRGGPGREELEAAAAPGPWERTLVERTGAGGQLRHLLEVRVRELVDYQGRRHAASYADFVSEVRDAEQAASPGSTRIAEAVARHLFTLMAYKDEYEVARLHLLDAERARLQADFGKGAKVYWHLHPPLLRALGMRRKLRFGPWFKPVLRALRAGRRLRGTPLDPFGHTAVRRTERALITEYRDAVGEAMGRLGPSTYALVLELCELPDLVRGYEQVKLEGVERFRQGLRTLEGRIAGL